MDMGIPSVAALAYDPSTFPDSSEIVWTAGTTPDPQKALSRTLAEVAQLAGDFNTGSNYVASGLPKLKTLREAYHVTHPDQFVDIRDLPDLSDNNIKTEIERCVAALSNRGMEVIVVNTMHPLLEIPSFYTIIPGAHFRERALGTSVGMFSAKLMTENRDPVSAIRNLEAFDRKLPGQYYVMFYLGTCHIAAGDPGRALAYLQTSLSLNPNEQDIPSIYAYMAICLKDRGEYDQALEVLKQGEAYDSERTDIYNLMGFCHFKRKEHEESIECFKKAIALDPGSAIDYANIASNYRDMGQTPEAVRYYEMALTIDPTIDFARDNLQKLKP
jgi:ribosomal protein S12 methylthiotransferase accessory factor